VKANIINSLLILNTSALIDALIIIDINIRNFRFSFENNFSLNIQKLQKFIDFLANEPAVVAIMIFAIGPQSDREKPTLFFEFSEFNNVFSNKNTGRLPAVKANNHAIEFGGKKPPFEPIHNLL